MIRKEIKEDGEKLVFYIIDKDINVSAIISELSTMGCKGEELGKAYRKLTSDDKGYLYENEDTKEKLLVIDESKISFGFGDNPFLCMFWALLMMNFLDDPYKDFVKELKKGGEEIK